MEMFGGISHLQYHLAKILGNEVDLCLASTPEIIHIANQSIFQMHKKRDQKEEARLELANRSTNFSGMEESKSSIPHFAMPSPSTSSCLC